MGQDTFRVQDEHSWVHQVFLWNDLMIKTRGQLVPVSELVGSGGQLRLAAPELRLAARNLGSHLLYFLLAGNISWTKLYTFIKIQKIKKILIFGGP